MDKIMNCKKCKWCGKECRGVIHEIQPNEYLCDKCFWGKEYREELYDKDISERTEAMLKQYAEWVKGIEI